MGTLSWGSISDVPPAGPALPPGASLSDITAAVASSKEAYDNAKATFDGLNSTFVALKDILDPYISDPSETPTLPTLPDQTALDAARLALLDAATTYVTNVAYWQLWQSQNASLTVISDLNDLIARGGLLSSQVTSISNIIAKISTDQDLALSAFKEYRHAVYQSATAKADLDQKELAYYLAVAQKIQNPAIDTTAETKAAYDQALATYTTFSDTEAVLKTAFLSARNTLTADYNQTRQFGIEKSSITQRTLDEVLASLGLSSGYTSQKQVLEAYNPSLSSGQLSLPKPSAYSELSMIQLASMLARSETISIQMIQQAAMAAAKLLALFDQLRIYSLMPLTTVLPTDAATLIQQAIVEYNASLSSQNEEKINQAISLYNSYVTPENIAIINQKIAEINTRLANADQATVALFTDATAIQQASLDIINATVGTTEWPHELLIQNLPSGSLPEMDTSEYQILPIDVNTQPISGPISLSDLNTKISDLMGHFSLFATEIIPLLQGLPGTNNVLRPISIYTLLDIPLADSGEVSSTTIGAIQSLLDSLSTSLSSTQETKKNIISGESALLAQLFIILGVSMNTEASNGLLGLFQSSASTGTPGTKLAEIMASTEMLEAVTRMLQTSALLAGLSVIGQPPQILEKLTSSKLTLAELLEAEAQKSGEEIDNATQASLATEMVKQLSTLMNSPEALQEYASSILKTVPAFASIDPESIPGALSAVSSLLQSILATTIVGIELSQGGASSAIEALLSDTISSSQSAVQSMLIILGIPMSKANEMATIIAEDDRLLRVLANLNIDDTMRAEILALSAANAGGISLTSGVPGGPAYLNALLSDLQSRGITVTGAPGSAGFMQQLIGQLKPFTNEEGWSQLQRAISPASGVKSTGGPLPTIGTDISPLSPRAILDEFMRSFTALNAATQQSLIAQAAGDHRLANLGFLSPQEKAALLAMAGAHALTRPEMTSLLLLLKAQAEAAAKNAPFQMSALETSLVERIFRPSPEEQQRREEIKRQEILDQQKKEALKRVATILNTNSQTLTKFIRMILDPGYSIILNFSLRTRSADSKGIQPNISLSG